MDKGEKASCMPNITDPKHSTGSDPKYIKRIKRRIIADIGSDTVVDSGFGIRVTTRRKMIGMRHMMTAIAEPAGPVLESITAHSQFWQLSRPIHDDGHDKLFVLHTYVSSKELIVLDTIKF